MDDRTVGEKMTQDLGLNPGLSVNRISASGNSASSTADAEKDITEEDI